MTHQSKIYKCNICGNIVEVLRTGAGELVCCGQPMQIMEENTVEASIEKHVPVIEKTPEQVRIKVGSISHPMEEKHYIEWIEIITDGRDRASLKPGNKPEGEVYRAFLKHGDMPEAEFTISAEKIEARGYCNLHGLWRSIK